MGSETTPYLSGPLIPPNLVVESSTKPPEPNSQNPKNSQISKLEPSQYVGATNTDTQFSFKPVSGCTSVVELRDHYSIVLELAFSVRYNS